MVLSRQSFLFSKFALGTDCCCLVLDELLLDGELLPDTTNNLDTGLADVGTGYIHNLGLGRQTNWEGNIFTNK